MLSQEIYTVLSDNLKTFAVLKLSINKNSPNYNELTELYTKHIDSHNAALIIDAFPNSGFDIFVPEACVVENYISKMISMDVKCEMVNQEGRSCGYFMFPRSSISKTPLMLANHTGIIDSGYRGNLIGAFRNLANERYNVEKHTRLLQICDASLCPVYVVLVSETDFSITSRGEGGFGSTGK